MQIKHGKKRDHTKAGGIKTWGDVPAKFRKLKGRQPIEKQRRAYNRLVLSLGYANGAGGQRVNVESLGYGHITGSYTGIKTGGRGQKGSA